MQQRCRDGETCVVFRDIEIETVNRCNGQCSFCPVNVKDDPRTLARMEDSIFTKIVHELAAMSYQGLIGLSSNNEPYIDEKIIPRIAQCRAACPQARLYLYTNGTLLNAERVLSSLRAGLDRMVIDDYSDDLSLSANASQIVSVLDQPEHAWAAAKVDVVIRQRHERLRNRAGRAPNKLCQEVRTFALYSDAGCTSPFKQMVIRPTGKVSLCCNDALGEVTLGDVNTQGLLEIWNGPEFRRVRGVLLTEGRKALKLCSGCDVACLGIAETMRLLGQRGRSSKV
jgi:MoaA/NifB/PqqE/SkfB family radical SAM enzyme